MARFAFEALGIELTESQTGHSANKANRKKSRTMKKIIAAAGLGAAITLGSLVGAGTANASTSSFVNAVHNAGNFSNENGDAALVNNGRIICQYLDQGYMPGSIAYVLMDHTSLDYSGANKFISISVSHLC
jgi:Protein of unknown function (DUF732)